MPRTATPLARKLTPLTRSLLHAADAAGLGINDIARACDRPRQIVRRWRIGESEPANADLANLAASIARKLQED